MNAFLITLALISVVVLVSPAFTSAATNAGVKPGSFWYGSDLAFEKINLFFTFNSEGKAKKALEYADERLAEAEAVAANNNTEAVKEAITNYESNIAFAAEKSKDVSGKEKAEALLTSIADNTSRHQEILADVLAKVPDGAKEAITKAIEASRRGREEAMRQVTELRGEVRIRHVHCRHRRPVSAWPVDHRCERWVCGLLLRGAMPGAQPRGAT